MLKVRDIEKVYGDKTVLHGVSFNVARGEVVGFLGPNGAGKTTTMRIICGFIPATSGRTEVDGLSIQRHPIQVRRRIGYLPENVPLYDDHRVIEYLRFRARLKRVPWRHRKREIQRVMEWCFLQKEERTGIRHLSKGFRQRVGLADALLGRPKLLVLDEPTAGLDPNQVRRIRALIQGLADSHTVLLSTHLLPEVEAVCQRAIIVHEGYIVADEDVRAVARSCADALDVNLIGPGSEIERGLSSLPGVASIARSDLGGGAHAVRVTTERGRDLREAIGAEALKQGWVIRELTPVVRSLEDVFVQHTAGTSGEHPGLASLQAAASTGRGDQATPHDPQVLTTQKMGARETAAETQGASTTVAPGAEAPGTERDPAPAPVVTVAYGPGDAPRPQARPDGGTSK